MPRPDVLAFGAELHDALAAVCARAGTMRGMALLAGPLESARVSPGPDARALALSGPLYLVQGTATISPGGIALYGVISWEDQGLPRMVAGRIEAAIGAGVAASLVGGSQGGEADDDDDEDDEDEEEAPARPARSVAPRPAERPARVDLTPEMSALKPREATPARPSTARLSSVVAGDDARAKPRVAAAQITPQAPAIAPRTAPAAASKPAAAPTGGWAAAVSASSRTPAPREKPRAAGDASPDELGFEEIPALRIGDVLIHPRFAACVVSQVSGRDRVKVRRQTGASFDLALSICRFRREPDDAAGRRVFRLVIEAQ